MASAAAQNEIDRSNEAFWNELCGSNLARGLGVIDNSSESLRRFDRWYFDFYPYLERHIPFSQLARKRVLEVGLGYGTVGQRLTECGAMYMGLDIASGPVAMMQHRLAQAGLVGTVRQASFLEAPVDDESVDCVVAIGCFHHTGNMQRCIDETWRVLRPGGSAYIMVYNQFSYRQWMRWPLSTLRALLADYRLVDAVSTTTEGQRKAYDTNLGNRAAPETAFFSIRKLRRMFARFAKSEFRTENCSPITVRGHVVIPRDFLLPLMRWRAGLDVYIAAVK